MAGVIERFFEAWSMTDEAERRDTISEVFESSGQYADPRSPDVLVGHDAIADYVAMFSANAPGWTARVVKSDRTAGLTRATVAFGGKGPDGSEMIQHGQYFAETNDERIERLIGFVGTGAPI